MLHRRKWLAEPLEEFDKHPDDDYTATRKKMISAKLKIS
jgi:hypothetical protein